LEIKDIQNYSNLIDIINDNKEFIELDYNSKKNQIVLHKELFIKIVNTFKLEPTIEQIK